MSAINTARINYLYKEYFKEVSKKNNDLKYDENRKYYAETLEHFKEMEQNGDFEKEIDIEIATFKYCDENIEKAFIIKIDGKNYMKNNYYTNDLFFDKDGKIKSYTPNFHHNLKSFKIRTSLMKIIANKVINIYKYSINSLYRIYDDADTLTDIIYNILSQNIGELIRVNYERMKTIKENKNKPYRYQKLFEYKILKEPLEVYTDMITLEDYIKMLI